MWMALTLIYRQMGNYYFSNFTPFNLLPPAFLDKMWKYLISLSPQNVKENISIWFFPEYNPNITRELKRSNVILFYGFQALYSSDGCKQGVSAEDLIRYTKSLTNATAKCVAAGISNKQDDIIAAANLARKSISDMLVICKSAAYQLAENEDLKKVSSLYVRFYFIYTSQTLIINVLSIILAKNHLLIIQEIFCIYTQCSKLVLHVFGFQKP